MKASKDQYEIAKALSEALEPLIDVCLQIGVTSPELESLLQAAFVQRAFVRVPGHSRTGRRASAVQVGIATGVHRDKVSRIRAAGGVTAAVKTMESKRRLHSKGDRVLMGWVTDPKFKTSGGHPLDLPFESDKQRRGFEDLVKKFAPGVFPSTVLKELRRRGNVELVEGKIIRFLTQTPEPVGLNKAGVARAAKRLKRLGDSLFQAMSGSRLHLYEETGQILLTQKQLAMLRPVLAARFKTFVAALESELRAHSEMSLKDSATAKIGVSAFSWGEE